MLVPSRHAHYHPARTFDPSGAQGAEMIEKRMAYISGALSDLSDSKRAALRTFYEFIANECEKAGFRAYVPHVHNDPIRHRSLLPHEVDRIERTALTLAYVVICYVGASSLGVGIALEMAYHANKPVILLYEQEALEQRRVSRLARGNPAVVHEIVFVSHEDAIHQLRVYFPEFLEERRNKDLPLPLAV